ncbi:AGAP006567-PA-like protein [Anopheles sinensis]|uniref:AGAP006567-PA-like protein n=1 Tax=Anopheles sinensis TaxID=74873 RepID=A0A084WMP9_ANOSI|nr:AGAP006567-PA-like protein [Anopheles sinensis]
MKLAVGFGVILLFVMLCGASSSEGGNCPCVVCQTKCKTVSCDFKRPCPCELPRKEFQCPQGFTWNGAVCLQDYATQIKVDVPCCCV